MLNGKKGVKCLEVTEYLSNSGNVRSVLVKIETNQNFMLLKDTFQKYVDEGVIVIDSSTKKSTKSM